MAKLTTPIETEQFAESKNALTVRAPAKINLSLLVSGKRPDGFHNLETIMAKICWHDEIIIEKGTQTGIELICKGNFWAPENPDNLVFKAAKNILNAAKIKENLKITLIKNIPAGTGLGSASSDAAATLLGVNKFLKLGLSGEKLHELGAELGSDVAFFIHEPLSFCTGRGEKITPLSQKMDFWALLILPELSTSTKTVYQNYKHDHGYYEASHKAISHHLEQNRLDLIAQMQANMLEKSCFELHPKLLELKLRIEAVAGKKLMLSGSGSTLFYFFGCQEKEIGIEYQNIIERDVGCNSILVSNNRW